MLKFFSAIGFALCLCSFSAVAQQEDDKEIFCDAVRVILKDGVNQFRNVRGRMIESGINLNAYNSSIAIPGIFKARFVGSMGLFYEGAIKQTANLDEIKPLYEQYKKQLDDCLSTSGYKMKFRDNFFPGLADYKKVVYMPIFKEGEETVANGHVTLEVDFNKNNGTYTLLIYIFEK